MNYWIAARHIYPETHLFVYKDFASAVKLRFSRWEFLGIFCKIIIIAMPFCKCIMKNASTKPLSGAFLDLPLLSVRTHVINVWLSPTRYPEPGRDWRIFRRVIQINCNPWGYTWGWGEGGDDNWKKLNHALKFDKWGFNFSSEILNAEILGFSVPSFIICKTRETSPNTSLSQ